MNWKHTDDEMPKEHQHVWAWYGWESRPVKAYWKGGETGEPQWMHCEGYTIGVRYWMNVDEMRPKCERLDGQMGR